MSKEKKYLEIRKKSTSVSLIIMGHYRLKSTFPVQKKNKKISISSTLNFYYLFGVIKYEFRIQIVKIRSGW